MTLLTATGVEGIVGRWGSGKTLVLAALALDAMDDPLCSDVWATFHVRDKRSGRESRYLDPDLIGEQLPKLCLPTEDVRAGRYLLVLVDEAAVVMPSRMWDKMPVSFLVSLAQGRKRGVRLRWAAQSEKRVDTVLREVTTTVWRCACWRPFGISRPVYIRMREHEPGESDEGDKVWIQSRRHQMRIWRLRRAMDAYDTLEQVKPAAHLTAPRATRAGSQPASRPATGPPAAGAPGTVLRPLYGLQPAGR